MVKDGGCPFMFDGALSFDRVLMPALRASAALEQPPSTTSWSPSPIDGGGKCIGARSPSPLIDEEAGF